MVKGWWSREIFHIGGGHLCVCKRWGLLFLFAMFLKLSNHMICNTTCSLQLSVTPCPQLIMGLSTVARVSSLVPSASTHAQQGSLFPVEVIYYPAERMECGKESYLCVSQVNHFKFFLVNQVNNCFLGPKALHSCKSPLKNYCQSKLEIVYTFLSLLDVSWYKVSRTFTIANEILALLLYHSKHPHESVYHVLPIGNWLSYDDSTQLALVQNLVVQMVD